MSDIPQEDKPMFGRLARLRPLIGVRCGRCAGMLGTLMADPSALDTADELLATARWQIGSQVRNPCSCGRPLPGLLDLHHGVTTKLSDWRRQKAKGERLQRKVVRV